MRIIPCAAVGIIAIARRWPDRFVRRAETGVPQRRHIGNGTIMIKATVTVAVLALGLAACKPATTDNNAADTNVENAAMTDVNAASNDATANADAALNAAGNAVDNAGNAVDNAGNAVANASSNAAK